MRKRTFIDGMTGRGYEPKYRGQGVDTVRYVPPADHIVCVGTPTMTAITRDEDD